LFQADVGIIFANIIKGLENSEQWRQGRLVVTTTDTRAAL
jgi:hypothetical protein